MNVTDRSGQTPFAVALRTRDHEAAGAILAREPGAAEQVMEKLLLKKIITFVEWRLVGLGGGGGGIVTAGVFVQTSLFAHSFSFPALFSACSV